MVTIDSKKIASPSNEFHFGTVFAENGLFVLLEVEGSEKNPAHLSGKEILDTILTKYTNYQEQDLSTISGIFDSVAEKLFIRTIIIGIQQGAHISLGSKGSGEVKIHRGGKIGTLISGEGLLSGEIHPNDQLLFYSDTFSQFVSREDKETLLSYENLDKHVSRIGGYLNEKPELQGAAALVLSILSGGSKKKFSHRLRQLREALRFLSGQALRSSGQALRFLSGQALRSSGQAGKNRLFHILQKSKEMIGGGGEEADKKKILLIISGILVILLIGSIFFNVRSTRKTKQEKQLAESLNLVSHQYEEAASLIELNPVRARSLLSDSKLTLSPLLAQTSKNSNEYTQINEWLAKIAEQEVAAYKIYKLTSVPLFFDISLVKSGGEGEIIASYKEKKAILDTKNQVVYTLYTDSKQAVLLAGSETVKDAKSVSIHGNTVYLITSDGVVGIDTTTKSAKVVIQPDEKWGSIVSLSVFGGNIYLLDRTKHTVWKYIATDFGFSMRTTYLNPGVQVNFADSKKLIIDGSVWVLMGNDLLKFTRGLGDEFAFKGFSDTISHIKTISTSEGEKNLYLLDPNLSRIIVFDKDGQYQAQYQWDELKNAQDIVASEAEKKIFVLVGSKIYAIDLK